MHLSATLCFFGQSLGLQRPRPPSRGTRWHRARRGQPQALSPSTRRPSRLTVMRAVVLAGQAAAQSEAAAVAHEHTARRKARTRSRPAVHAVHVGGDQSPRRAPRDEPAHRRAPRQVRPPGRRLLKVGGVDVNARAKGSGAGWSRPHHLPQVESVSGATLALLCSRGCRFLRCSGYRRVTLDDHLRTLGGPAGGWSVPVVTPQWAECQPRLQTLRRQHNEACCVVRTDGGLVQRHSATSTGY